MLRIKRIEPAKIALFLLTAGSAAVLLPKSSNLGTWAVCFGALGIGLWILGARRAYPVLLWLFAISWIQVAGDVLTADLVGNNISGFFGRYSQRATLFALAWLLALAIGIRSVVALRPKTAADDAESAYGTTGTGDPDISRERAVISYVVSIGVTYFLTRLSWALPGFAQMLVALTLLKFVCIYLVAASIFASNRGWIWLVLVLGFEVAVGMIGFFAAYKEPVFIVLLALLASRRRPTAAQYLLAIVAVVGVVWMSLVWTAVKNEYRRIMPTLTLKQQVSWMYQQYSGSDINYAAALLALSNRIGATNFFAAALMKEESGSLMPHAGFYSGAIRHVVTPRIFFPDKGTLDDSKITSEVLSVRIAPGTSMGLGYVTQAYLDFGFPGMLVPAFVIGLLIGFSARYFMSRNVPLTIRYAFATTVVFNAFQFAANIDKSLGMFIMSFVVLALALRFGYPRISTWLRGESGATDHSLKLPWVAEAAT